MRLYFLIVLCRIFVLNGPTKAEENLNTIEIQSSRKMEGDKFFPIETRILTGTIVAVGEDGNNENLPADGKTRILMLVGHPGNDKVYYFYIFLTYVKKRGSSLIKTYIFWIFFVLFLIYSCITFNQRTNRNDSFIVQQKSSSIRYHLVVNNSKRITRVILWRSKHL